MHSLANLKLTILLLAFILIPLSQQEAGIRGPRKATTGHFNQWFFYTLKKVIRDTSVYFSLWWGVLSSPLNGWPGLAGTSNLIHSTAQRFEDVSGGLFSFTRNCHVTN